VDELEELIDRSSTETGFSGVVRVDRVGADVFAKAYGLANRIYDIANTVAGQFAIASGTKGLTALTMVSLIADGHLELATTARSLLGDDLLLIDDAVTVEHLLAHRCSRGVDALGLGFWLHETRATVMLEGFDAGVSFRTAHDALDGFTHTVISNTSLGTWPMTRHLDAVLTAAL
jgi:hypothetical protein